MSDSPETIQFDISQAAWNVYASNWFDKARAWSPFFIAVLSFFLGIPVFEYAPVWLVVIAAYVVGGMCVSAIPLVAGLVSSHPKRRLLYVDSEAVYVSLERELTIPLEELTEVRCHPPIMACLLTELQLRFDRRDGSAFLVWTHVTNRGLFEALEKLNQKLSNSPVDVADPYS